MSTTSELLVESSAPKTAWLSVKIIFRNLPLIAAILVTVCLPLDLAIEFGMQRVGEFVDQKSIFTGFELFISTTFYTFASLVGAAVMALVVGQIIEGEKPTLHDIVSRISGSRLIHIVGTLIYTDLAIFLPIFLYLFAFLFSPLRGMGMWALYIYSIPVALAILLALNFAFNAMVAVFESTFYNKAATRSVSLVRGRRLWLIAVFGAALIVLYGARLTITILPEFFDAPEVGFSSWASFVRLILESLLLNITGAWFFVFQSLIYFRRRREVNDLTFFDLSNMGTIKPASLLLES